MTTPSIPVPVNITKSTRVEVGMLITLIGAIGGGAFYLSNLNSNVVVAIEEMKTMRRAIERHTQQLAEIGKSIAVLETRVSQDRKRLDKLEDK